jgi:cell division protein FtsA
LGLILKGYDDFEHNRKQFDTTFKKVEVPQGLKGEEMEEEILVDEGSNITVVKTAPRKGISNFWGKFKNSLIDMFKEEEDSQF